MEKLRMSRQDLKEESKESEGSPEVKARMRRLQMEASQRAAEQARAEHFPQPQQSDAPRRADHAAQLRLRRDPHPSAAIPGTDAEGQLAPPVAAASFDILSISCRFRSRFCLACCSWAATPSLLAGSTLLLVTTGEAELALGIGVGSAARRPRPLLQCPPRVGASSMWTRPDLDAMATSLGPPRGFFARRGHVHLTLRPIGDAVRPGQNPAHMRQASARLHVDRRNWATSVDR